MQPSQPGQTQPGQQPGAATQSQSPSAAGRPSIDDQVQSLAQQLNLSTDQQAKVKTALEDQHTQAMNVVQDNSMARDDKIQKIHTIRQDTIDKVRSALNDDQKKKFDAWCNRWNSVPSSNTRSRRNQNSKQRLLRNRRLHKRDACFIFLLPYLIRVKASMLG